MSQLQNSEQVQDIRPEQTMGQAGFLRIIQSLIGQMHTVNLVMVKSVSTSTNTCDIQPLTMLIDGSNNAYERGTVYNVPYWRLQGGGNAIVCNPHVGDIGVALFCERDISMVKRNKSQQPPNTKRQFDLNDAIYLGGVLNSNPSQYVEFLDSGMNIKSTGDININGLKISSSGTLTLANGVIVDTHIHSQGNDSDGNSEQDTGIGHN